MDTKRFSTSTTETVTISRAEYERLQEQIAALEQQVELLMEALRLSRHRQYGASSEKSDEAAMEQLSLLFNEAEACAEPEAEVKAAAEGDTVSGYTRRKKQEYTLDKIPENVPVEVVEHHLEGEALVCPVCAEIMREIGTEVVRTLKLIPARVVVVKNIYHTYACRHCDRTGIKTPIVTAPREKKLIPGSFATPEAVAHLITQKFVMGSPLYRQAQELKRQGIELSRQTMSNWVLRVTEDYLVPVYEQLHRDLLAREVLHADETTLQVLREPGKRAQSQSYLWLYRTSGDTDRPIVLCEYQPDRKKEHPKAFLTGFRGYLHTDGYEGYHSLAEEIRVVGCWAHARRYFDEAIKAMPKGKEKTGSAYQGLCYCNKLFQIEEELTELTPEERYQARLAQAKPVTEAMLAWAETRTAAPKSALGKALTYLKSQWPYLMRYLEDGRLELSNNRTERSIKPFVIDRNFMRLRRTTMGAKKILCA